MTRQADYVGSTTGIMAYAEKSDAEEFIIGTENSIVEHLQFSLPDKKFYPLSVSLTCMDMKVTTLMDVYNCLEELQRDRAVSGSNGRRRKMYQKNG